MIGVFFFGKLIVGFLCFKGGVFSKKTKKTQISQLYLHKNCVSYRRKKDVKPMNLPILSEYYIKMTFNFRGLAVFR